MKETVKKTLVFGQGAKVILTIREEDGRNKATEAELEFDNKRSGIAIKSSSFNVPAKSLGVGDTLFVLKRLQGALNEAIEYLEEEEQKCQE